MRGVLVQSSEWQRYGRCLWIVLKFFTSADMSDVTIAKGVQKLSGYVMCAIKDNLCRRRVFCTMVQWFNDRIATPPLHSKKQRVTYCQRKEQALLYTYFRVVILHIFFIDLYGPIVLCSRIWRVTRRNAGTALVVTRTGCAWSSPVGPLTVHIFYTAVWGVVQSSEWQRYCHVALQ